MLRSFRLNTLVSSFEKKSPAATIRRNWRGATITPRTMVRDQSTASPTGLALANQSPGKEFFVPVIDMGPFLQDPASRASAEVIANVRSACTSTGFFQIENHGIPSPLQDSLFGAAEKFFKLPFDEKKKLDARKTVGHRGYDVLASQSYEEGVLPDLKEVWKALCKYLGGKIRFRADFSDLPGVLHGQRHPCHRSPRRFRPILHGSECLASGVASPSLRISRACGGILQSSVFALAQSPTADRRDTSTKCR